MAKGKITYYEQFLLLSRYFQILSDAKASLGIWEKVKELLSVFGMISFPNGLLFRTWEIVNMKTIRLYHA